MLQYLLGDRCNSSIFIHNKNLFPPLTYNLNLQETGSVLESLIVKRTEYLENCNRTLSILSQTGEPSVKSSNVNHSDCSYMYDILVVFDLQESIAKEHLTCLCVGPIHLLEMCQCPAHLTYHGSVRVTFCLSSNLNILLVIAVLFYR